MTRKLFYFTLFYIFKNIYLFIWLPRVLVAAGELLSCGSWAPQLRHGCGIQFPDQGRNPSLLHWECGVLTTAPPGKSQASSFRLGGQRKPF